MMPSMFTPRRRFLGVAGTVGTTLLAGCTDRLVGGSSAESTLVLHLHHVGNSLRSRYVIDLTETQPGWARQSFTTALNGSDFTTQHRRPFPWNDGRAPVYTRHNGTYYHLDSVIVGEETVTHSVLRLVEVESESPPNPPQEAVARDELPPIDQAAVRVAHLAARARGNQGGAPWGLIERGGAVYRTDEATAESRLLDDAGPTYVTVRDELYRVETTVETFHEAVYRPDIEAVAETESGMEAILRAGLVEARVDPETLSPEAREIISSARREGYEETHPFSDAFTSLLKQMDQRAYIDGDITNDAGVESDRVSRYLGYGDDYYEYRLYFDDR